MRGKVKPARKRGKKCCHSKMLTFFRLEKIRRRGEKSGETENESSRRRVR